MPLSCALRSGRGDNFVLCVHFYHNFKNIDVDYLLLFKVLL